MISKFKIPIEPKSPTNPYTIPTLRYPKNRFFPFDLGYSAFARIVVTPLWMKKAKLKFPVIFAISEKSLGKNFILVSQLNLKSLLAKLSMKIYRMKTPYIKIAKTPNCPNLMISDNYFMEIIIKMGTARIMHWYWTLNLSKVMLEMSGK